MYHLKTFTLNRAQTLTLVKFVGLLAVAIVVPLFHQQWLTGPIVNAALFLSVYLLSIQYALFIALIPSVVALSVGLLPLVLAPMVPFIMISNCLLIIVFAQLRQKNYGWGVVTASVVKFLFLFSVSKLLMDLLLKKELAIKVAAMMSWPQLFTALLGGALAFIFLKKGRWI